MAGGMTRRSGPALSERVRAGVSGDTNGRDTAEARHCWVVDAPGHPGRWPGVLLEWRRDDGGWAGRVAYGMPDVGGTGVRLCERWIAAQFLEPRP